MSSYVIFNWSPADLWSKDCSRDRDASKQRARNIPLASADVHGRGRLREEHNVCLGGYDIVSFSLRWLKTVSSTFQDVDFEGS